MNYYRLGSKSLVGDLGEKFESGHKDNLNLMLLWIFKTSGLPQGVVFVTFSLKFPEFRKLQNF